jgi:uncharacterized protein
MLLDTSGLFAFLDASDHNHTAAAAYLNSATLRVTHSYVLAELIALTCARRLDRATALQFVGTIIDHADFEVDWITQADHREAMALLNERHDKLYSLCDAVSCLVMRRRALTDALTTDHHFEQEGLVRLLKP